MVMGLWTNKQMELAGLDVGYSSAKLVKLKKTADGYTATAAAYEPFQFTAGDEADHKKNCIEAIKRCFDSTGIQSRTVTYGLFGPEIIVRDFHFAPIPEEDLESAVFYEARQVCPLDVSQSVLDYQLIATPDADSSLQPRHGLMAVAARQVVKDSVSLLNEAGVKPVLIDIESLALLNCLNELDYIRSDQNYAVINVGANFTSVIIYGQNGMPFVRDINHTGSQIIRQIGNKLNLTEDRILKLLKAGPAQSDPLYNKVLLAMNEAFGPLVSGINETLRFYMVQGKVSSIDKIFLCGGFSMIQTFVDFMSDALAAETEVFNPFDRIRCEAGSKANELLKKSGPALAVAAGLAMRTV